MPDAPVDPWAAAGFQPLAQPSATPTPTPAAGRPSGGDPWAAAGFQPIQTPVEPAKMAGPQSTMQQIAAMPGAGVPGQSLSPAAATLNALTSPLNQQREQSQAALQRQQQGFLVNALAGYTQASAGIAAPVEKALGFDQAAENTANFAPDPNSLAGKLGGFAGSAPQMLAGPAGWAVAGANTAGQVSHGLQQQMAAGGQVNEAAGLADILLQGGVSAGFNALMAKGITGDAASSLIKSVAGQVPGLAGKLGIVSGIEGAANAGMGLASNAVTKATVNPNQSLTEGVGGQFAAGAIMGPAAKLAHEAYSKFATPISPPASASVETPRTAEPTEAAKPVPPVGTSEQVPTNSTAEPLSEKSVAAQHPAIRQRLGEEQVALQEAQKLRAENEPVVQNAKTLLERLKARRLAENPGATEEPKAALAAEPEDHYAAARAKIEALYKPIHEKAALDQEEQRLSDQRNLAQEKLIQQTYPESQAKGRENPAETKFAEQKAGLLPAEHQTAEEGKPGLLHRLIHEEEGGTQAPQKFVEETVKPALADASKALGKAQEGIADMFGQPRGALGEQTEGALRARGAKNQRAIDIRNEALHDAEVAMDKLPKATQQNITDRHEQGLPQHDPAVQGIMDNLAAGYAEAHDQLRAVKPDVGEWANYLAREWKDPQKAAAVFDQALARRPFAGRSGMLKGRVFEFAADARAAGLEAFTDNPVTMYQRYRAAVDRYTTAKDFQTEFMKRGAIQEAPKNGRLPEGYVRLTDPIFHNQIAPEALATPLNNLLDAGLAGHPKFGGVYRGVRSAANLANMATMSMSAFHATTSALNSAISELGMGIEKALSGKPIEGAKSAGLAFTGIGPAARDYWNGTQLLKEWKNPGSTTPELAALANAMERAGGRANMDSFYHEGLSDKMLKAFRGGNSIEGALRLPGAALEQTAKPIMEYLVPRLKMGAFMQMMQEEMGKGGDLDKAARTAWDSVDNRFGEVVHDNAFWNRTLKDAAHLGIRSVGWNRGTILELGGGIKDLGAAALKLAQGQKPEMTHRMAYSLALPVMTGVIGAVTQYAMTGKPPTSLKDLMAPKIGGKDAEGNDRRIVFPTYMKDAFAAVKHPLSTISSKLNPLVGATLDMMANKDYTGTKIANEDDPWIKQQTDRLKYLGKQTLGPMSVENMMAGKGAGSFVGISKAPSYISQSDAEQQAYKELDEAEPKGTRTAGAAARSRTLSDLAAALRNKDPDFNKQYTAALKAGTIQRTDFKTIEKRAEAPPGLAGLVRNSELHPDALMRIWKEATPEEQKAIRYYIRKRVIKAPVGPDFTEANRKEYLQETANAPATQPAD